MGNMMQKNPGSVQTYPQQGGMYAPYQQQPMVQQQPQYAQQPMMMQQPQFAPQQPMMQQPQYAPQQPQYAPQQPQYAPQQPQFAPQQPGQYRPGMFPPQQGYYRPSYPSAPYMPRYPVSQSLPLSTGQNPASYYENDAFLANLTGWTVQDIERLRHEFLSYTNAYGVIDREGFRKLYVASLLNMTWEALERDAESAFRNFDINQTGGLDFNEYVTACSRMTREINPQLSSPPPPSMNPSFTY